MSESWILVEAEDEVRKMSPRDAYIGFCLRADCKPILAVADLFSGTSGDWASTVEINLSRTYVGPRGVLPVIDTCKFLTRLRHLDISDNYLTNECAPSIAELITSHPSLESLELKGNRHISWTAAMYLAKALSANSNVVYVGLLGTSVDKDTCDALFSVTRRNASNKYTKHAADLHPSTHRNAVQIRAMKQYFFSLADANGEAAMCHVEDGRRERRLLQGFDSTVAERADTEAIGEERTSSHGCSTHDTVTWEQFLVLVMLDDTIYDADLVHHFLVAFERFNVLPDLGVAGGVVEVKEFAHILSDIYALPPQREDVVKLKAKLGLDDTMTVNWDEFLYTFYHTPSDMSVGITGCVATPLPSQIRALHY